MTQHSDRQTSRPRVVVGVSDSPSGRAAVREAAREAAGRGVALVMLRVWTDVDWMPSMTCSDMGHMTEWERADRELLDDSAAWVRTAAPDLSVLTQWQAGDLYVALQDSARGCELMVVGSGDEDRDAVAGWLRRHVDCPVLSVPAGAEPCPAGTATVLGSGAKIGLGQKYVGSLGT